MRAWMRAAALTALLVVPAPTQAQNAVVTVGQTTLNGLVRRLGSLADSGVFVPTILVEAPRVEICELIGFLDCPGMHPDLGFPEPRIPLVMCWHRGGGVTLVPGGDPVSWQWWVTNAHFTLASGSMTFTATVKARAAGRDLTPVTRTVPASVRLDTTADPVRLRIQIDPFRVPIRSPAPDDAIGGVMTEVDVARLHSIAIPLERQQLIVPRPEGGSTTLNGRVAGMTPEYLSGRVRLRFDVAF